MSSSMNGRAFWDGHHDSLAERCGRLIDNGVRKLGIKDLSAIRVNPTKLKDVMWAPNGATAGRAWRRLDRYPDVRGLDAAEIAKRFKLTQSVAGRLLALQLSNPAKIKGGAAK